MKTGPLPTLRWLLLAAVSAILMSVLFFYGQRSVVPLDDYLQRLNRLDGQLNALQIALQDVQYGMREDYDTVIDRLRKVEATVAALADPDRLFAPPERPPAVRARSVMMKFCRRWLPRLRGYALICERDSPAMSVAAFIPLECGRRWVLPARGVMPPPVGGVGARGAGCWMRGVIRPSCAGGRWPGGGPGGRSGWGCSRRACGRRSCRDDRRARGCPRACGCTSV